MSKSISDSSFKKDVLEAKGLVMVDLWAEWCGPCKQLSPIVDELAKELKELVIVCKLDVDKNQEIPSKMNVRGIPTLLFFKDGKLVDQLVGNQPKLVIKKMIETHSK